MSNDFSFGNVNFVGHPFCNELRNEDVQLGQDIGDMCAVDIHLYIECENTSLKGSHIGTKENRARFDGVRSSISDFHSREHDLGQVPCVGRVKSRKKKKGIAKIVREIGLHPRNGERERES